MKKVLYKSDVLESEAKGGKTKYWQCRAIEENGKAYVETEYWQGNGKHQISEPYEVYPKNEGKKNGTTAAEQAILTVKRKALKQLDSGYTDGKTEVSNIPLPMLALSYHDRKHNLKFPCIAQPKLDGCRCLVKNGKAWSRKGKQFQPEVVDHIMKEFINEPIILDGELMVPGVSFQDSMSYVKKRRPDGDKLNYYIYDIVDPGRDFSFRSNILKIMSTKLKHKNIKFVQNIICNSEKDIFKAHKKFVKDGYEGTILRNLDGKYLINHRSSDLLKLKDFIDDEFEIIGSKEGEGRNKGCITFICKTEKGTVDVNLEGPLEERKKMWEKRETFIGKMLTIQFFGYTDDGSLRFPVGKGVRDYE